MMPHLIITCCLVIAEVQAQLMQHSKCRFSPYYTWHDISQNSTQFEADVMYWDGQFHQNGIGYNANNGMTYDGCILNSTTGLADVSLRHQFSAASKEALQIMVYTHAILRNPLAARFVYPWSPVDAPDYTAAVLEKKLTTYRTFNNSYPGFGGFLPWFLSNETSVRPTADWVDRVPGLDNGELLWAVYGLVQALHVSKRDEYQQLGASWQKWLDDLSKHAVKMFYLGQGRVCAVVHLNQSLSPLDPAQNYTCEKGNLLNDPYEGELFTWWLYFFGGLPRTDRHNLWILKRSQLVAMNYTGSTVNTAYDYHGSTNYSGSSVQPPSIVPITAQRGFWFSSHEQWKLLEMPYLDIDIVRRVFKNAERVRTCNSNIMGQNAGMFASVNGVSDPSTDQILGYISNAGIPSISVEKDQRLDVITPYSVFPTILFNRTVGLIWYKNMLDAKAMQNPYGSTVSTRRDGTGVSSFVSWDSKVTTIVALLGGVGSIVRDKMIADGIYHSFCRVLEREYGRVFGEQYGQKLAGEEIALCLPNFAVPVRNISDYTMCA